MWRSDSGLTGNSVVVTGAAGGIGSAVAMAFAEAGARVLLVDIPGSKLAEVLSRLNGSGHAIL
jgi:NAD(P)-dependent dehydrogenase (short-subunit alcohol dehydrogenase family)